VGIRIQYLPLDHARRGRFRTGSHCGSKDCSFPGSSVPWTHYLCAIHPWTGSCIMGCHRRDVCHPSQTSDDWYRPWLLLHRQYPLHLLVKLHAQPHGKTSRAHHHICRRLLIHSQGGDLGGKCGYVWGATGFLCFVVAFFYLPEMKGRSYREIDILFKRKVPARKWKKTVVDVQDDS
jgi:hypothetical protein